MSVNKRPENEFFVVGLVAVLPKLPVGRALVPGAGRAYDAKALAEEGNEVVALDLSPTACEAAKQYLGDVKGVSLVCGDFFDYDPERQFDLLWDATFLCALDPSFRKDWAKKIDDLLAPNGVLCTLIFPMNKQDQSGPPFELSLDIFQNLLTPLGFVATEIIDFPVGTHMPSAPFGNSVAIWERPK